MDKILDFVFYSYIHGFACHADLSVQGNLHEKQTKGNIFLKMQIIFINNFTKFAFLKGSIARGGACRRWFLNQKPRAFIT